MILRKKKTSVSVEALLRKIREESMATVADIIEVIPEIPEKSLDEVVTQVDTLIKKNGDGKEKDRDESA